MKKILAVIFSLAILSGCAANENTEITEASSMDSTVAASENKETTTKAATEVTTTAAASAETTAVTYKKLTKADLGVNEDGTLNDTFTKIIEQLIDKHMETAIGSVYPTLWDFDSDDVPEIVLTVHNGNQGTMPCTIYSAESLEEIGEFDGFCRDGFTRFTNRSDGDTIIYNYYEHSNWQRVETVEFIKIKDGKLVGKNIIVCNWQTDDNMVNAAMVRNETNYMKSEYRNYKFGDICTSYGLDIDSTERSEAVVESYNNYIKSRSLLKNDDDEVLIFGNKNQYAFFQTEDGCYFIDENGEATQMESSIPYYMYKLNDDIIVCEQSSCPSQCDIYIMVDNKLVLDEKISGYGCLSQSKLYNGGFEIIESVRDRYGDVVGVMGTLTSKRYQLYRDENGFHEYGSITVPIEKFNKFYGEAAQECIDNFRHKIELYEVLYRGDCSFILNCRIPNIIDGEPISYEYHNITTKPTKDGGLVEVYNDTGIYKTALIPEIAVYPEKYYTEDEEWDKCIVN